MAFGEIIPVYKKKLSTPNTKKNFRRKHKDLGSFLKWNFEQIGRVEAPVRKVAFSLLLSKSLLKKRNPEQEKKENKRHEKKKRKRKNKE